MRNNIQNSNEIKDFYEVDIKYFPYGTSVSDKVKDILYSLFYNIYKKYINKDIIFLYTNKDKQVEFIPGVNILLRRQGMINSQIETIKRTTKEIKSPSFKEKHEEYKDRTIKFLNNLKKELYNFRFMQNKF